MYTINMYDNTTYIMHTKYKHIKRLHNLATQALVSSVQKCLECKTQLNEHLRTDAAVNTSVSASSSEPFCNFTKYAQMSK